MISTLLCILSILDTVYFSQGRTPNGTHLPLLFPLLLFPTLALTMIAEQKHSNFIFSSPVIRVSAEGLNSKRLHTYQ